MGTRAIIGFKRADGTFIGGWQWNDGMGLAPLLRRHFKTIEQVNELIHNGVWNNISSPRDNEKLKIFKEFSSRPNSSYYTVEAGKCKLLKERPCDSAEFCFGDDDGISIENGAIIFDSFLRAAHQDVSYIYEFDCDTNEWKVFTYKNLISMCKHS